MFNFIIVSLVIMFFISKFLKDFFKVISFKLLFLCLIGSAICGAVSFTMFTRNYYIHVPYISIFGFVLSLCSIICKLMSSVIIAYEENKKIETEKTLDKVNEIQNKEQEVVEIKKYNDGGNDKITLSMILVHNNKLELEYSFINGEKMLTNVYKKLENEKIIKLNENIQFYAMLDEATDLKRQGKYEEAFELAEKVLNKDGESISIYSILFKIKLCELDFENAIKYLTRKKELEVLILGEEDPITNAYFKNIENLHNLNDEQLSFYFKEVSGNENYLLPNNIREILPKSF